MVRVSSPCVIRQVYHERQWKMIVDLHVHTSHGSGDSSLSPQELVEEARRIGLQGACLTEHSGPWDRFEFQMLHGVQAQARSRNVEDSTKGPEFTLHSFDGKVDCSSESEVILGGLLRCLPEQVRLRTREAQCIEVQGKFAPPFQHWLAKKTLSGFLVCVLTW